MAVNWRDGEVKLNHDHLKAVNSDNPVGKAMEWGTWPGACKVWGLPLDSRWDMDVILGRCVLTLGTQTCSWPLPSKRSLWASSIVLLSWIHGHCFGFCIWCHANGWSYYKDIAFLLMTDKISFSFKFLWLLIHSLVYGFYYIFKEILGHTWKKRVILSLTVLDNPTSDNILYHHTVDF